MKNIILKAKEFENVEEVKKAIRNVQSLKSRLRKQKARTDYNEVMENLLKDEELLKGVRTYLEPKKKFVTEYDQSDVDQLNLEQTIKAIKSIQSKKCNTQFLTEDINKNTEYQNACKIEEMLLTHKDKIQPLADTTVTKKDITDILNNLEQQEETLDKEYVMNLLSKFRV